MADRIRVVIADDQPLVRSALRLILEGDPELTVLGEAADGQGALDAARRLRPDIILLDLHMPGRDGVWASERISELAPDVKVLVLTAFDTDRLVASALRAGAVGLPPQGQLPGADPGGGPHCRRRRAPVLRGSAGAAGDDHRHEGPVAPGPRHPDRA